MPPEHAHLLLVHLPIVGLLAALLPLAWAVARGDRTAAGLGLALAALFGAATPLVARTGEAAEERFEDGPLALDAEGARWLEVHEDRGEVAAVVASAAAAACAVGLVLLVRAPALPPRALAGAGAAACVFAFAALAWAGEAGGKIRHPELRGGATAAARLGGLDVPARGGHAHDD